MRKSLVAFDAEHIKNYVFGTDKLKEIRGASSLLDYFNRYVMEELARSLPSFDERGIIYANGGSGLFVIDENEAHHFGLLVQKNLREMSGGGASITYVVQELPEDAPDDIEYLLVHPIRDTLELMRYRLRQEKERSSEYITLASHPFMRSCDACGIEYATGKDRHADADEQSKLYCTSCLMKRERNAVVRDFIAEVEAGKASRPDDYLWDELIKSLRRMKYDLLPETRRPQDFNAFYNFKGSKDYLGFIYADGNSMGQKIEDCDTLAKFKKFAEDVDDSIYEAVSIAINKHLQIKDHRKRETDAPVFPFDILLLGGDDSMMVVPASVAMDVALTIAQEFHTITKRKDEKGKGHTLSVGVVLVPIKYPFGLSRELVESTLKFAKKEGAKVRAQAADKENVDDTRINFMTVTGSTSNSFEKVFDLLHQKDDSDLAPARREEFYATLRPYDPQSLHTLLDLIREGRGNSLGRTKLHQVREAVLKMNLATSVSDGLAVLRNWKTRQREYVIKQVYTFGGRFQAQRSDPQVPASMFPRVTFPWFADGKNKRGREIYRTSLLDFLELYDFVSREEAGNGDEN